jgi:DNA-binding transcriptional MerR regulator
MSPEYFKIGNVAGMLNTTVRTIRYYEEEGLLFPHRTDGGTRLYSEHHVDRLKAILHLAENGFSLDVIGLIAGTRETCSTGDEGSKKVTEVIDRVISEIDEKISDLNTLRSDLKASRRLVAKCKGCTNKPSSKDCQECSVNQNLRLIEALNLIWE